MKTIYSNRYLMVLATFVFFLMGQVCAEGSKNLNFDDYVKKMTPLKGLSPVQWRLIWTGDVTTQAILSWSTAEPGKKHVVHYDTVKRGENVKEYKYQVDCHRNGAYSIADKEKEKLGAAYYHHAKVEGLEPDTTYYFVLESDGQFSKPMYFITAPKDLKKFSLIHGGDSRSGLLARCKMNELMAKLVEEQKDIYGLIHGGDYIVSGRKWSQWRIWLSSHELTTTGDGRVLPILPARGNHDGGPIYKEIFDIQPEQPDWHTTTIGNEVAIVTLDTNRSGGGDQVAWLEGELKRLRPQSRWLLTQYHRPLYPAVKKAPAQAKIFCPLFEKYNVDLACEADGHCIKRTSPIRDGKIDPTGVTYIGEGGLGVGQRKPKADLWYLKDGLVGSAHHVMLLKFDGKELKIDTILMDGKIMDSHPMSVRTASVK